MTNEELVNQFFDIITEHNLENIIYVHYYKEKPDNTEIFKYIGEFPQVEAKVYVFEQDIENPELNSTNK